MRERSKGKTEEEGERGVRERGVRERRVRERGVREMSKGEVYTKRVVINT